MMTDRKRSRVNDILREVLELPAQEREQLLDQACGDEPEVAEQVREMLSDAFDVDDGVDDGDQEVGRALQGPLWKRMMADLHRAQLVRGGECIGPYTVIRRIGHGGMGEVYLATSREDSVGRMVALKVAGFGVHGALSGRRFEQEQRILSSLDHEAIARFIGGGLTADERPYFAMEYVDGLPLDQHCDQLCLPVEERLRLSLDVARAVQHAHRHMVVHRDLKPSNILVTQDGRVKLLDFGIAKLLEPEGGGSGEPLTRTGLRVLTPEFASPEQVLGGIITTASDIYQLGVVMYLLLCGRRPYRLTDRSAAEIEQIICEQEPPLPSVSIFDTAPGESSAEELARMRGTHRDRLSSCLKGDLDTIVLMALRKEPDRRYQSVEQLIRDIEGHRKGHPVSARRASAGYRLAKFVRRHTLGLSVAATALLLTLGFSGYFIMERHDRVRRDAARAELVASFLEELFDVPGSSPGVGRTITAKDLLDRGADRVASDLQDQPQLQATLKGRLGGMYRKLGMYEQARALLEQALQMQSDQLGDNHVEVSRRMVDLGLLCVDVGRYDEAEALYLQALKIRQRSLGEKSTVVARCKVHLGNLYLAQGRLEEAERLLHGAFVVLADDAETDEGEVARLLIDLSSLYWSQGKYDRAEELLPRALDTLESEVHRDDQELAIAYTDLGQLYAKKGDRAAAERLIRRGYELTQATLGPGHPQTAISLKAVANFLVEQGKFSEAEGLFRQVLTTLREAYGANHPDIGETLNDLAILYWSKGDYDEAERQLRQALAVGRASLGPDHPGVAAALNSLGALYWRQGKLAKAEAAYGQALQQFEESLGAGHPDTAVVLLNYASVVGALGEYDRATDLCERAVASSEDALGSEHPDVASARGVLASMYAEYGHFDKAQRLLTQALQVLEQSLGPEHVEVAAILNLRCSVLFNQGHLDEARASCERALEINREVLGPDHLDVADSYLRLAQVCGRQGGYRRAEALTRQALRLVEETLGADSPDLVPVLTQLAGAVEKQGRSSEAMQLLHRALAVVPTDQQEAQLRQRLVLADAHLRIGELHDDLDQSDKAKRLWLTALALTEQGHEQPSSVTLLRIRCMALLRLGRVEEARRSVEQLFATGYADPDLERLWDETQARSSLLPEGSGSHRIWPEVLPGRTQRQQSAAVTKMARLYRSTGTLSNRRPS